MVADPTSEPARVGRYADPSLLTTVDLGSGDSAQVRAEIGDGEIKGASGRGGFRGDVFDGAASDDECIASFVASWTLVDREGEPLPITAEIASLLDDDVRNPLLEAIALATPAGRRTLPNGSGGRSPAGSPGTGSRRRVKAKP